MTNFINYLIISGIFIFAVVLLSSITGYLFSKSMKKKGYILDNGTIVNSKDKNIKMNYLQFAERFTPEMKSNFTSNPVLQDFSITLGNIEGIPSGRVRKLFLSGRGSWRVTCGNIFTQTGFEALAEKEYSQML